MNSLNSVLIEGLVVVAPGRNTVNGVENYAVFEIVSARFVRTSEGYDHEDLNATIAVSGKLADTCMERLEWGRGIRAVGRLAHIKLSTGPALIGIIAEHIEFKPVK